MALRDLKPSDIQRLINIHLTWPGRYQTLLGQEEQGQQGPTLEYQKGGNENNGKLGTWEVAGLSIAQAMPALVKLLQPERGFAPTPHVGDRYPVPAIQAAGIFPQRERYRSLLAQFLR